jgi:hypothetical protein
MEKNMPEETAQQSGPNLTIGDLILTAQIIQAAAAKGVFKAEELRPVGDFYERLVTFLEASGAISRQQPAAPESAPAPATNPTQEKANAKTRRKA